jgi:hypothetical protein
MVTPEANLGTTGGAPAAPPPPAPAAAPPAAAPVDSGAAPQQPQGRQSADELLEAFDESFFSPSPDSQPSADAPPAEGQPQSAKDSEPDPEPAAPAQAVDSQDDPLAEFERRPPTREEIDTRFARVSTAARDEIFKWADEATKLGETVRSLGGEHGLSVAASILPHVLDPNPTPEKVNALMTGLVSENPRLVAGMGQELINAALNDETHGEVFASRLLTEEFGAGYDLDRIRHLVEFDKANLINFDELKEDFTLARQTKSPEVEALEKKVAALEGGKEEEQQRIAAQASQAKKDYSDKVDAHSKSTVNEAVAPIWKKMGWMPTDGEDPGVAKALTRFNGMVNRVLDLEIRQSPEWANIEALKEQGRAFDKDNNPTSQYKAQLENLKVRAQGIVVEAARDLQPVFAAGFKSTRRARLAPPGSERDPQRPLDSPSGDNQIPSQRRSSVDDQLAEMDRRFDTRLKDEEERQRLAR